MPKQTTRPQGSGLLRRLWSVLEYSTFHSSEHAEEPRSCSLLNPRHRPSLGRHRFWPLATDASAWHWCQAEETVFRKVLSRFSCAYRAVAPYPDMHRNFPPEKMV